MTASGLTSGPANLTVALLERFISNIIFTGTCWLWTGETVASRGGTKYGRFFAWGSKRQAHRVSYALFNGPLDDGVLALHLCHVPLCVNPDHLEAGGQRENMWDRDITGRTAMGERHGRTRHPDELVRQVLAARGTPSEIGKRLGLSRSYVANIQAGRGRAYLNPKYAHQFPSFTG
jgi:hypothetical protein